jgi:PAS domain S-box-containing protein
VEESRKISEIIDHQKIHAKQAAKSFKELFDKWNSVLYYLSNDNNVILLNENGRYELEKLMGVLKDEIKAITRTDKTGKIIFTTPFSAESIGADISHQKHMVRILSDHKPVVSDVFDAVQGYKAIVIHYPVFKNGQFDGTVAVLLDFEQITKDILDEIKIGKSGHAWMLSSSGIELYNPLTGHIGRSIYETANGFPAFIHVIHQMLAGKEGIATYPYYRYGKKTGNEYDITYYLPINLKNTFWALAISYSRNEITESLIYFRNRLIFIFAIIFLIGAYFSYFGLKAQIIIKESSLRKEVEETLRKERSLLRLLIDNLPSGVFIKDKNYRKIIVNPLHIESVTGHRKKFGMDTDIDLLGKTDFEVFPKEYAEQFFSDDKKIVEEGLSILNNIESGFGPDGEILWLLVSKVPVRDEDGSIIGMLGITTDITERKKVEEELTVAKEKAEESDKLKTAFLNNISHEIRTPLNAILGFAGLLNDPDLDDERRNYYIEIIIKSSHQLLLIMTDIINIATIEAGQVTVHYSEVDVNSDILILFEQHKGSALSKDISLKYTLALTGQDAKIITDQTKFIEILSNLLNNAIKFTEKGEVRYGYELKNNMLQFYVEDSGIGILPEYQQIIFDRFKQAKNILSLKYGGTGLGLSISKAYVEVLGGRIWLTSEPGKGSTFYFTLPYKKT